MFTVKLIRQNEVSGPSSIRLVEAETVNIWPAGKPEPERKEGDTRPLPCTNKIRAITVELNGKTQVFHVGDDQSAIMGDVDLFHCAYIENSQGQTTERVYGF